MLVGRKTNVYYKDAGRYLDKAEMLAEKNLL